MPLRALYCRRNSVTDLSPLAGMKLNYLVPPPKAQLMPGSLKVIEKLGKQGCKIVWQE